MKKLTSRNLGKFLRAEDMVNQVHRLKRLKYSDNAIAEALDVPIAGVKIALEHTPKAARMPIYHDRYVIMTEKVFKNQTNDEDVLFELECPHIHGSSIQKSTAEAVSNRVASMKGDYGDIMVYRLVPVVGESEVEIC